MTNYVDSLKKDFTLSPLERKQREEILEAMRTVQSAIELLNKRSDASEGDLRARNIIKTSTESVVKLQNFVNETLGCQL